MSEGDDETLKRIYELMDALTRNKLYGDIEKELQTKQLKHLYELTDGKTKVAEIVKKTGMSAGSISSTWQKWYAMGLIKKSGRLYTKIFQ